MAEDADAFAIDLGAADEQVARILAAHRKVMDAIAANAPAAARSDAVRELITAQLEGRPAAARAAIGDTAAVVNQMLPQALAQMNNAWMRYFVHDELEARRFRSGSGPEAVCAAARLAGEQHRPAGLVTEARVAGVGIQRVALHDHVALYLVDADAANPTCSRPV